MTLVTQETLNWLIALLRDGRAYYGHAASHTHDPEVKRAFRIAAQARENLVADLQAIGACELRSEGEELPLDWTQVPAEQRYEDLRLQFDPLQPDRQSEALLQREEATLRLMESVFRSSPTLRVRGLMKQHYPRLQQASAIIQRMAQRVHAA
jgi:hypothetical protein